MSEEQLTPQVAGDKPSTRRKSFLMILNAAIFFLIGSIGFLAYSYLAEGKKNVTPPEPKTIAKNSIQVDVLNGSGARGVGSKFMTYLRASGYDVVDMKNYSSSKVPKTLVVDRVGNLINSRKVAEALGVSEGNIVQQINPDYFVDVSVIVGEDYPSLNPLH